MTPQGPAPAPRREAALLILGFALLALLRLLTVARDPWEWDEVLFTEAARDGLDVRLHHPHPPGYPGFVYPARLLVALGASPFAAVTAIGTLGGLLAVLGLYALLRAFGSERRFAALGAAAFALTPAVWLHAVRPLTDAPAAAAFLFASALLVTTIRSGSAPSLAAAAVLSALAAGIRPQVGMALLPAAAVAAFVVYRKERRAAPLVLAAAAGTLVSLAIWAPAIHSSGGLAVYRERLAQMVDFVREFERPRPSDWLVSSFWKRWWYDPFGNSDAAFAFLCAGASAFLLARRRALLVLALFLPITFLTMETLGRVAAPRYATAFLPLPAALLVVAAERLTATRLRPAVFPAAALLMGAIALPAIPALVEVHERSSPSSALMSALREEPRFARRPVWIFGTLEAHAREFLGNRWREVDDARPLAPEREALLAWADDPPLGQTAVATWGYEHRALLARISRGRYLSASLYDAARGAAYHVPEVTGGGRWRSREAAAELREPGAAFLLRSASAPVRVTCVAEAESAIRLRVATGGGDRDLTFEPGEHPLAFDSGTLLSITLVEGKVTLRDFRILAAPEAR